MDTSIKLCENPCSGLWAIVLHVTIFQHNRPWRPWLLTFHLQNLISSCTWHIGHFHDIWWKSLQRFMSNCTTCHNFQHNRPWRPWPLTFDLQNLISLCTCHSGHFHKIWWKSLQWCRRYRVNKKLWLTKKRKNEKTEKRTTRKHNASPTLWAEA